MITFTKSWAALLIGGLLMTAAALGYFLVRDGGAAFWDCTVTFNRHYVASDNFSWIGLSMNFKKIWSAWWILFLLAGAAFLKPGPRLWFWFGVLLSAFVATGASYYGQYYILLMPFWALMAVAGIHALAEVISRRSTFSPNQIKIILILLTIVLVCLPDAPWLTLSRDTLAAGKFARRSIFLESPVVGRRVAELSSAGDRIWVAASEPQILCYAKRQSATRFITVYALVIPSPMLARYQAEAIREVQANPPKLVVWSHSWLQEEPQPSQYLQFLNRALMQDYQRVGGYILDGKNSRWVEPLTDDEIPAASVILFERKPPLPENSAAAS